MLLASVMRKRLAAVRSVSKNAGPGMNPYRYAPLVPSVGIENAAAFTYWCGCVVAFGKATMVGCRFTSGVPRIPVLLIPSEQVPVPAVVVQVLTLLLFTAATAPTGTVIVPLIEQVELMIEGRLGPLW